MKATEENNAKAVNENFARLEQHVEGHQTRVSRVPGQDDLLVAGNGATILLEKV